MVGKMYQFRFLYELVKEKTKTVVSHVRPFISILTAPKSTDDALQDGMKGPSLRQVTVRVRAMDETQCNTKQNTWMARCGRTKGPNPWQTTAKANNMKTVHWQTSD